MLQVKTYLAPSKINGLGLHATEDIPKGTIIWTLSGSDVILNQNQVDCLFKIEKAFIDKYAYKHNNLYTLCTDDARFMNHSSSPNTDDVASESTIASENIKAGEEITCNYASFDDEFDEQEFHPITKQYYNGDQSSK